LEFRLPPFLEQKRIVDEIEKQFTRLDAAVAALKRVQANLKRYHASVLRAACEGRLVPTTSETGSTSVALRPVKELLSEPLVNGRSPTSATGGAKILRLTSMKGNFIDFAEFRFGDLNGQNLNNLRVQEGDIFVARGSGSVHLVGRASLARALPSDYIAFPDTMIRIRLNRAVVEPLYFIYLWNSALVRTQIEGIARTTAGIHKISQRDIENITLPLVPLVDQRKVVLVLEEKFSTIDAVESTAALDLSRGKQLRQAILKNAFEGKLAAQDPNDESANTLLERIRVEREVESRGSRKGAKEIVTR
jgi:type I restriction enzyme S subunit